MRLDIIAHEKDIENLETKAGCDTRIGFSIQFSSRPKK
jgi:hypothetical protein